MMVCGLNPDVCVPLYAQGAEATILGTVSDSSSALVPNAQVSIKNVATGIVKPVVTNKDGFYSVPGLLPGKYEVTATARGFATTVASDVVLRVGAQQEVNLVLRVGEMTQKIEVTDAASTVELATSTLSGVVDSNTVRELPLNGRSWTDLATLEPGVNAVAGQPAATGTDRGQRGLGAQLTISGARPQQNSYLLDGINVQDYSNGAPGSVLGGSLGVDAIQEFSVLTSNYSTQYGRTSGGVVNAVTRSGTNAFHGSGYEFFRHSALDARSFFDTAKLPFHRNQFGASLGGPIQKDKTFIFGNYEGLRQLLGFSVVNIVPSPAAISGRLCNAPDCSTTTPVMVDAQAALYLKTFYPAANGPVLCPFASCVAGAGDTAISTFSNQQTAREDFFTVRLDHVFSEKDSLYGTYFFDDGSLGQADAFDVKKVTDKTRRQLVTVSENHIFGGGLVNSFRAGYNRVFATAPGIVTALKPEAAQTKFGFVTGDSAGEIHISGGPTTFAGGLSPSTPLTWGWNSIQAYDDVFLTRGIHSIKLGANFERILDNLFGTPHPGGRFFFNSLSDFLTNRPATFSTDLPGAISPRRIRETVFGMYVQDDVRFRPYLTFNLGLRYEIASVPSEADGKLSSLRQITDAMPHIGAPLFANPTLHNFEPRVGFSWDPFHNGKTAIRGGFGMFDVLPLPIEVAAAITNSEPFYLSGNTSNLMVGDFPTNAFQTVLKNPTTSRVSYVQQNPPRNYVLQWNLNIQREILPSTTAMIAYVGSRGVHNTFQADDANIVLPKLTPKGYLWPFPSGSGKVLNPNFGRLSVTLWDSSSNYNGLAVSVTKRLSRGFQIQGSYSWAKAIDSSSGAGYSDPYANSITSLFFFDQRLRRGLSDLDVRHNFTLHYLWLIPAPQSLSGFAGWATHGWQLGGILTAASGTPFTPLVGPDPLGLNSTDPFAYPDGVKAPGCGSSVNPGNVNNYIKLQCFAMPASQGSSGMPPGPNFTLLGNSGRNDLIGPGLLNFDASLYKDNRIKRISENFSLQFRAEFFNILNHPNFLSPLNNSTLFNPDGTPVGGAGMIDTTKTIARQIQFGVKVNW
jgi:hypothetical protein